MRHRWISAIFIGMIVLGTSFSAYAATATFEITATVYEMYDPGGALNGGVNYGDQIKGTYTVELSTPDNDPGPEYGHYMLSAQPPTTPPQGFDLLLNNFSLKSDPNNPGYMLDAYVMNSYSDHFGIGSWGNVPLSNGSSVEDIFLDLYDSTGTALTSTELTSQAPDITKFELHDLHVSGMSNFGQYYNVIAKIDSIKSSGGSVCVPLDSSLVTFDVSATVREVWDYDNVLSNSINPGDELSGSYTFNVKTPDSDSNPYFGRYEHTPGSGDFGFNLNIAGVNVKTDPNSDFFSIRIEDNPDGPDSYSVDQNGTPVPFINNSSLDYLSFFLFDFQGGINSGTELTAQPPNLSTGTQRDLYFGGSQPTSWGTAYFSVVADVNGITNAKSNCAEPENPVTLSPASGVFDRAQRFDAAIILKKDLPPIAYMVGTFNGFDISPKLLSCFPGAPNGSNRQSFVCPDFSQMLMPGPNHLKIVVTLMDGQVISSSVDWLLLGY